MLSFIRLGAISFILVVTSFLLVHLSSAEEVIDIDKADIPSFEEVDIDEADIDSLLYGLKPPASSSDKKLQDDQQLSPDWDDTHLGQIAQAQAEEKVFPLSGVLSDETSGVGMPREIYVGDVIAYNQYRVSGYVAPFSVSLGKIIGRLDYWTALNAGDVVFIDIGTNKGAKVGDHFSVISNDRLVLDPLERRGFKHEELYKYNEPYRHDLWADGPMFLPNEVGNMVQNIGILKITKTGADKSKAIIQSSNEPIFVGDNLAEFSFERPTMISSVYTPLEKKSRTSNMN